MAAAEMMPTSIGPYAIVRRLGRGGMAEVFLARAFGASGFERLVAIKTLAPELAGEAELERALVHEATLGARLAHRNVRSVLGLDVATDGAYHGYYVVLEYLDGGDLATLLRAGPLPESLALHVAHEVALGLAYLHGARDERGLPLGIVHRDVAPANILVSTSGDTKLADLGIAKATALADRTAAGTRKGRHAYMAPEQLAGERVSPAADQFGLAVTLVELLTAHRPFAGQDADAPPWVLLEQMKDAPDLDGVAPDLVPILEQALAPEPAARFASGDELRRAIRDRQLSRGPAGPSELGEWASALLR
ncbi:MAG TPA: serine/threonine-protein kinase [Kofleriaceae bacterium]|jgi:serine/threonine-protein kinase